MSHFVLDASVALAWVLDNPVPVYTLEVRQEMFRGKRDASARAFQLTAYDAVYVELARREGLPRATLDKGLRAAAAKAGVPLLK